MDNYFPDFTKQYNDTYKIRLNTIKPLINEPTVAKCEKIHDLNNNPDLCLVKGILFISSDLKTTIFDRIKKDEKKQNFKKTTYISKDVKYFVEDETGRIELIFNTKNDFFLCTGMCLGFIGSMKSNKFKVERVVFPDSIDHNENKKSNYKKSKICFMSGFELSKSNNNLTSFKVITDYLFMQEITELVIIGCFFKEDYELFKNCVESSALKITLIPEYSDFGCLLFPIYPVLKKLLSKNIVSHTNPCIIDFCNKTISITSHEIIKDLLKYIDQDIESIQYEADGYRMHLKEEKINLTPVEIQEFNKPNILKVVDGIIKCRLLCPNGPDTLHISPYNGEEIFLIDKPLDFFFIPNCDNFIFEKNGGSGCRIVSVPNFNKTNKVLLVDFDTEDYKFIEFSKGSPN